MTSPVAAKPRRADATQGHTVDIAGDGRSATQLLDQGDYDLVLLDLFMPDMDGYAVMQYMLKRHPKVAVIVVSGDSTIHAAVQALRNGAYDLLRKP
jgi:DNA-binding NtrC family response regulator